MVVCVSVVVFLPALSVGVGEDPHFLEQFERPVDGRGVYPGSFGLHSLRYVRGGDVPSAGHDLGHDGAPLLGHAMTAPAQQLEHAVGVRSRGPAQFERETLAMSGSIISRSERKGTALFHRRGKAYGCMRDST